MEISKRSIISGKVTTRDLDVSQEQFNRWNNGESIQSVFTNLNASDREFLMTGITDEEWPSETDEDYDEE